MVSRQSAKLNARNKSGGCVGMTQSRSELEKIVKGCMLKQSKSRVSQKKTQIVTDEVTVGVTGKNIQKAVKMAEKLH